MKEFDQDSEDHIYSYVPRERQHKGFNSQKYYAILSTFFCSKPIFLSRSELKFHHKLKSIKS